MQNLSEIRELLARAGHNPRRALGQHFLIDGNLMRKLLELAELTGQQTVLEVGPATGSLTEELLARTADVVAVEMDAALAEVLRQRLGECGRLSVLNCDVLAGKHALAPQVLRALRGADPLHLVSNLPYNVAVPLVLNCLLLSWRSLGEGGEDVCFQRLTFTVQRELVERLTAEGGKDYGPASVIVALLARATPGRMIPPESFWPRPKVHSQMLRLDFDPVRAAALADAAMLSAVLSATFEQRRKKIGATARRKNLPFPAERFWGALGAAEIDPSLRPEQVGPEGYLCMANALSGGR